MENAFSFTSTQLLLVIAIQIWMVVVFPVLVLRKLNYLTALLEAHLTDEEEGGSES